MNDVAWDFSNEDETFDLFNSEMDFIVSNIDSGKVSSNKIAVAVSGGSDSLSLLILLKNWTSKNGFSLTCVTVDHKLREESHEEALFVRDFCNKIGVNHAILEWNKDNNVVISHGKIEDLARSARYNLINEYCEHEAINIVAIGHTWNDQLETFEMRKNQKSAELGLAGMSRIRSISKNVKIIRPIMVFSKDYLRKFLISKKIPWKNDPMNDDSQFRRVFYRKNIASMSREELQKTTSKIKSLGKKRHDIEKRAVSFLKENIDSEKIKFGYMVFDSAKFLNEEEEIQAEILKRAIWNIGVKKYAPTIDKLTLKNIIELKKIKTLGRCLLKVTKKQIAIFRENRNLEQQISVDKNGVFLFDNRFLVSIQNCKFHDGLTKYVISSLRSFEKIVDEKNRISELPHEVVCSLPCVYMNDKLLFDYGIKKNNFEEYASIKCEFACKVNLFDIFL